MQVSIKMIAELTQPGQHVVNIMYECICVTRGIQETVNFVTQKTLNVYGKEMSSTYIRNNLGKHVGVSPPKIGPH